MVWQEGGFDELFGGMVTSIPGTPGQAEAEPVGDRDAVVAGQEEAGEEGGDRVSEGETGDKTDVEGGVQEKHKASADDDLQRVESAYHQQMPYDASYVMVSPPLYSSQVSEGVQRGRERLRWERVRDGERERE